MSSMAPQGPNASPHSHPSSNPPSNLMSSSSPTPLPSQQLTHHHHHSHSHHHQHLQQQQQQQSAASASSAGTGAGGAGALSASGLSLGLVPSPISSRSSGAAGHQQQQQQQQLMLNPEPLPPQQQQHHHQQYQLSLPSADPSAPSAPARIKLADILPDDGAPLPTYTKAVEALSGSLTRYNAAVIELSSEDAAVIRCALDSAKLYFKSRSAASNAAGLGAGSASGSAGWPSKSMAPTSGSFGSPPNRGVYVYRAGRTREEDDSSPPCMSDVFRCLGKVSRAAISAIARHLRLRSDVFNRLLDDVPLPPNEVSSSMLMATYLPPCTQGVKSLLGGGKSNNTPETEKGLLTLIACDNPGIQVCDPNSRWYLADSGFGPGDILLLVGRALSHATAGLRPAASYRTNPDLPSGRVSLAFKLMPQNNAILDCTAISEAGHVIPQSYGRISVSQFMDELTAEEAVMNNGTDSILEARRNQIPEPTLRVILSDPSTGCYLEDAVLAKCGHSFGGATLRRVYETSRCATCGAEVDVSAMVPNIALRAAASAVKLEDERKQLHNAAMRRRRKEAEQGDRMKRDDIGFFMDRDGARQQSKGVQYPFSVNERVKIKGNKRTPDKFVGKEAIITSQCLNGWYLLRALDTGESVRLQYRSLEKIDTENNGISENHLPSQQLITNTG
eukprot:TRINITY_DN7908_c0_g1_i3.p1 TRINITY_DN7908_c0_g1~~TRINITY_DN7908_c0_g1_i3.p1  ORF type:complete len:673 (+),score=112.47 TRINITY_DN7908_c0_g1_i3:250-2268(+)